VVVLHRIEGLPSKHDPVPEREVSNLCGDGGHGGLTLGE
jgi:hypothetical protein